MKRSEYTASQSQINNHIAVFLNGTLVANINASRKLSEKELQDVADYIGRIRDKK